MICTRKASRPPGAEGFFPQARFDGCVGRFVNTWAWRTSGSCWWPLWIRFRAGKKSDLVGPAGPPGRPPMGLYGAPM